MGVCLMQVRDIREALAEALANAGFRVYDVLPESGQLPLAAVSWPDSLRYHRTGADGVELDLVVTVAVSLTDFARAQRDIDNVMSTPGLGTEIETYETTAWHDAVCISSSNVRQIDVGSPALAVDLNLSILA